MTCPPADQHPPTTAIVLAGGAGRRMGGKDKGLQPYQGRRLIDPVLDALGPQVEQLIISANRHLLEYRAYGFEVVTDATPVDAEQPYAGPVSALRHASTVAQHDWLLLAPCDMPGYQPHWPAQLWATQNASRAAVIIAHDGQRPQPMVALIHRPCLGQRPDLTSMASPRPPFAGPGKTKRGHRLMDLLTAGRYALCDLSADQACFANINTLDDLLIPPPESCVHA